MTTTTRGIWRTTGAGAVLALTTTVVGCSDLTGDATRSGGSAPPVVLTIGTDDPEGRPGSNQVDEFARQVAELSGGSLRLEPRYQAAGVGIDNWDQAVAGLVVAGDLDLALVPARAWDTEGVDTLRALTTPQLVTTEDHMDAVVADEELSRDLMSGLEDAGVTGLALLPEGIRYLMTDGEPGRVVARLADGGQVRSPWSKTTWAFFEALGARPTDGELGPQSVAAESQVSLAATLGSVDHLVGDLPLFPKVNALVANTDVLDALTDQQREWLDEAATATRDWAIGSREPDVQLATSFCADGGTVVHDASRDHAQVAAAAAEVTEDLREDEVTASLIDRIAALAPAEERLIPECRPGAAEVPASVTPRAGGLPDGIYRVEFTDQYLEGFDLSTEMVGYNHGVWTITLQDGHWSVDQVAPDIVDRFEGVYEVRGQQLFWQFHEGEPGMHLIWRVRDDGSLEFPRIVGGHPDAYFHFGRAWKRVGDVSPTARPAPTADTIGPDGGDLPDGAYRVRFTDDYLAAHGLPPDSIANNVGVWTHVLDDGHWTVDQVTPDQRYEFEGVYEVRGQDLWWRFHDVPEVIHLRWRVTDEGDLEFDEVPEPDVPDFQFDLVWRRVD